MLSKSLVTDSRILQAGLYDVPTGKDARIPPMSPFKHRERDDLPSAGRSNQINCGDGQA